MPLFKLNRDHRSVLQPAHLEQRQSPGKASARAVAFDDPAGLPAVIVPTAPRQRVGTADARVAPTPLSQLQLRAAPPSTLAKGTQAPPRAITALLQEIELTRDPMPPAGAAASGRPLGADGAYLTDQGQRVVVDGTPQAPRSELGDRMLDQLRMIQDAYELLGETTIVGDGLFQRMQDLDTIASYTQGHLEAVRLAWNQAADAAQGGERKQEVAEVPGGVDPDAPPAYVPSREALQMLEALTEDVVQQLADRRNYLAHTVDAAPTEAGRMYGAKAQICDAAAAVIERHVAAAENRGDELQLARRRKSADGLPVYTPAQLQRLKATRNALKARVASLDVAAQANAGQLAKPRDVVGPKMLGGFKALRHLPTWMRQKAALAAHVRTLSGKPGESSLETPVVDEQTIVETALARAFREAGLSPSQALHEMRAEMSHRLNAQRWDPITTEIQLQVGPQTCLAYSEIAPAAAFFPSYGGHGVNSHCNTEGRHAVNLAQTRLVDGQGNELFCAMRHGVVSAFGIVEKNVDQAHMSDDALTEIVVNAAPEHSVGAARHGANVARTAAHVRENAATVVPAVRAAANVNRAEEIVQAMILADRSLFELAVQAARPGRPERLGQSSTMQENIVPRLDVLSISLLTPDHIRSGVNSNERLMLADQSQAWSNIGGVRTFTVPHPDTGDQVQVKVDLRPIPVNYGVNQGAVKGFGPFGSDANFISGWDDVAPMNDRALGHLIGTGGTATPEEAQARFERSLLGPRVLALHAKADLAANSVTELLGRAAGEMLSDEPDEDGVSERMRARAALQPRIDAAAAEAVAARQKATLAQELVAQVREMHRDGSYRTAGKEPYKMPARLALLGHMLGVKIAFNCKSGKDRTGELDAETKHLRLQMELTGHVPHYERDRNPVERDHFHEVLTHSGNFEMQRLNTGFAGYKLHGVGELFDEFGAEGADDPKVENFHGMSGYTQT